MFFTAAMVPMVAVVGMAVDYARAASVRTGLQQSVDAAVLAAASARNSTNTGRELLALNTFNANVAANPLTAAATATATVTVTSSSATVTAQFAVPTVILRIVGINSISVTATSAAAFTGKKIELALMTDITGSMNENRNGEAKIDGLKTAARDLLDIILPDNMPPDSARVALIPFANYVNAGEYATVVTGLPATQTVNNQTKQLIPCVTERTGTLAYSDAVPTVSDPIGPSNQGNARRSNYSADGVCYRSGGDSTSELPEIIPLTTDKAALLARINSYQAGGSTAGHLGTAWAWYTISPNWGSIWPMASQPVPYTNTEYMKVVVLMTDGEYNTQYTSADSKTQALALCTAMKTAGVTVYTVGFGFDPSSSSDDVARNTLTDCASGAGHYYFPYDSAALRQTFVQIGNQMSVAAGRGRLSQ